MSAQYPGRAPQSRRRDPLGVVSLIAGAASHILALLSTLIAAVLAANGLYELTGVSSLISSVLGALLGLAALGFGIAALVRRTSDRAIAGAGTALGASAMLLVLATAVYPVVFGVIAG